jgi:WD40 repeat protein
MAEAGNDKLSGPILAPTQAGSSSPQAGSPTSPDTSAETTSPDRKRLISNNILDVPKPVIPDHTLVRLIGRGSYGDVWLARNLTGAYRAVKVLYQQRFEDAKPFEREFSGILRYEPISRSHDSQVDILHVGRNDEAGCFYYIMELADDLVRGQDIVPESYHPRTLRSEIRKRQRLPVGECMQIGLSLTTALGHLHRQGLVHRDIKPSNIIFINGIPKLADVGLIALSEETQSFVGTEGFLPPEGPGQPQADLYALGKVLYEISMGLDRKAFPELPTDLLTDPDHELLRELNEIILRACHPNPHQRYQTAEEMHADLALLQGGRSVIGAHNMERRLLLAKRYGRVLAFVALVASAAYYHTNQTKIQIARQLVRFQVAQGVQLLEQNRLSESLPWFAETIQLSPMNAETHRLRFGFVSSQCPRLVQLFPHRRPVNDVEFSSNGRWVITASDDGNARVWDLYSGRPKTPWLNHRFEVRSACFSRDCTRVVTASNDRTARLWDVESGSPIGPTMDHNSPVNAAVFSPDGSRLLTACQDGTARLWDTSTVRPLGDPLYHDQPVGQVDFTADGRFFLTSTQRETSARDTGILRIWQWTGAEARLSKVLPGTGVLHAAFSPDSLHVAAGDMAGRVKIWALTHDQSTECALTHAGPVNHVAYSSDGRRLVSASIDQTARVWDAATGMPVGAELRHPSPVTQARFSPDGRWIASASEDRTAFVYEVATGNMVFSELAHGSRVSQVCFDPSGFFLATAGADPVVRIWKLSPPINRESILHHPYPIHTAVLSPDGRFVIAGYGPPEGPGYIRIWNTLTRKQVFELPDQDQPASCLALSSDGHRLVSVANNGVGRVWDVVHGRLAFEIARRWPLRKALFSPHNLWVATAGAGTNKTGEARVWDANDGTPVTSPLPHDSEVVAVDFSPDSRRLITSSGTLAGTGDARIWDIASEKLALLPLKHAGQVRHACFSPDGQRIATASTDHTARLWNALTGQPATAPLKHGGFVTRVAFSPDSKSIVTISNDKTARIWNALTGDPISPPLSHRDDVVHASFSADGRLLATASVDGTARVWDTATGEAVTPDLRHENAVVFAALGLERQTAITASLDHTIRLWPLSVDNRPIQDLLSVAHLLSSQKIHERGGLVPLKSDEIINALRRLQAKYPSEFQVTPQDLTEWHQQQADHSERIKEWTAALFHLDRLMALKQADPELLKRRARVGALVR